MKYRLPILLLWLALTGWFLCFEAFPERFSHRLPGYRAVLADDVLLADSWMRLLFNGKPLGYSQTRIDVNEADALRHYIVQNHVQMRIKLMGETQDVHVRTDATLSDTHLLQEFEFSLVAPGTRLDIKARRGAGDLFDIETKTAASTSRQQVRIPDDVIIYSPMTEMAMRRLAPGESLRMRALDPASMTTADLTVRALRRETVRIGTTDFESTVLAMDYLGMEINSWIDRNGELLKQDTPFGWTLEKCTPEEAMDAVDQAELASDLLRGMAVRCKGSIRQPRTTPGLRLVLSGAPLSDADLTTPRQQPRKLADNRMELVTQRARLRPDPLPPPVPEAELAPHLRATQWIQSDNVAMIAQADRVVAGHKEPLEKAIAIFHWVHDNVDKQMTVSLPSALDVLKTMSGDCNEHTYLFVALARAAGLPSKVMVGVAYHEGAFYYHAWPAVYVGYWLEMDPTWGQQTVDAAHIALVQGEFQDQLALGRVIGRLAIEIVEEEKP